MKNLKNLKTFDQFSRINESKDEKQQEKYYHLYLHPCSTCVLYYFIPDEFNDILKSDEDFKIGQYKADFNDYLNKTYDKDRHGSLKGKNYIQYFGKEKLSIKPTKNNTLYEYKDMYYYEFGDTTSPNNLKVYFE